MTEISIFDGEQPLQITKPLRLIELFAGYGSQRLALEYLGIPHESYAISEWAVKSIQAYKDMHCPNDNRPYDTAFSDKEIRNYLKGRISADYDTPMTDAQIERMPIAKARQIVRNMFATNNKGSITAIKAADIRLEDGYAYLLSYSFPCQDLSSAGHRQGMDRGSSTRSGLLWEVERLLKEWGAGGKVPDVLLMENVPEVVGQKNRTAWCEWIAALDSLGYKSYWQILNATDFGIPQNRERCFMVSVHGDYYFEFPGTIPLDIRLKHVLQKHVGENYYLSDETVAKFVWTPKDKSVETVSLKKGRRECKGIDVAQTLRARDYKEGKTVGTREGINAVVEEIGHLPGFEMANRVYDKEGVAPSLRTFQGGHLEPKIIEEPQAMRLVRTEEGKERRREVGDTMRFKEGKTLEPRSDGLSNTISTVEKDNYVAVPIINATAKGYEPANDGDCIDLMYPSSETRRGRVQHDVSQTLTACGELGVLCVDEPPTFRIRKLTETECFRLMGVKEAEITRVHENQSKSSMYHLAGDSIVTTCLMALFGTMFDVDWHSKIKELQENITHESRTV